MTGIPDTSFVCEPTTSWQVTNQSGPTCQYFSQSKLAFFEYVYRTKYKQNKPALTCFRAKSDLKLIFSTETHYQRSKSQIMLSQQSKIISH